eukprot:gnl/TRDRNA2_/TRDRNA2_48138_c0_seq2.p1 gnl/TRDRNA2_/TRDRNA2_48138_c0~~gnl/TRDRNA2_/TRDRNA2_48138_c0_seq2.p1  ORF type:complete len:236 (+),score=30.78 gnl/TRDRNA2_/TRDRNA2_48138_c0_seq2:207-914(+)
MASYQDLWQANASEATFQCPKSEGHPAGSLEHDDKYFHRKCKFASGMWKFSSVALQIRCKYQRVAQLMRLEASRRVLDIGAGCGHALDMLVKDYGIDGVANDLVPGNAEWSNSHHHYLQHFCVGDFTGMAFEPESFDAIFSNAILHIIESQDKQCQMVKSAVRLLKRGGCAWFGWNDSERDEDVTKSTPASFWTSTDSCIAFDDKVFVKTVNELELFGDSEYDSRTAYSLFVCRK